VLGVLGVSRPVKKIPVPFFNVKILKCLGGGNYKKQLYLWGVFSNDDLGT
jgi:hypothetical protein